MTTNLSPEPILAQSAALIPAEKPPDIRVLLAGVTTLCLTVSGLYFINSTWPDINIMGWQIMFILPAGAVIVGGLSGSGYLVAGWWLGTRFPKRSMIFIALLQFVGYFASHYIAFCALVSQHPSIHASFFRYFHILTVSMQWVFHNHGQASDPIELGAIGGYLFRTLEIAGFVFGGLWGIIILHKQPYCAACQLYKKQKSLLVLSAGLVKQYFILNKAAAKEKYEKEVEQLHNEAFATGYQLLAHAVADEISAFQSLLSQSKANKKKIKGNSPRIEVKLQHCPCCHQGQLVLYHTTYSGKTPDIKAIETASVSLGFVETIIKK